MFVVQNMIKKTELLNCLKLHANQIKVLLPHIREESCRLPQVQSAIGASDFQALPCIFAYRKPHITWKEEEINFLNALRKIS